MAMIPEINQQTWYCIFWTNDKWRGDRGVYRHSYGMQAYSCDVMWRHRHLYLAMEMLKLHWIQSVFDTLTITQLHDRST